MLTREDHLDAHGNLFGRKFKECNVCRNTEHSEGNHAEPYCISCGWNEDYQDLNLHFCNISSLVTFAEGLLFAWQCDAGEVIHSLFDDMGVDWHQEE